MARSLLIPSSSLQPHAETHLHLGPPIGQYQEREEEELHADFSGFLSLTRGFSISELRKQNAAKKKAAQTSAPIALSQPKSSQGSSTFVNLKPSAPKEVPRPPKEVPKQKPTAPKVEPQKPAEDSSVPVDNTKKLRNLRKKLKEIETLEAKINSNELKNPDTDQLDKVRRKKTIEDEILALELDSSLNV